MECSRTVDCCNSSTLIPWSLYTEAKRSPHVDHKITVVFRLIWFDSHHKFGHVDWTAAVASLKFREFKSHRKLSIDRFDWLIDRLIDETWRDILSCPGFESHTTGGVSITARKISKLRHTDVVSELMRLLGKKIPCRFQGLWCDRKNVDVALLGCTLTWGKWLGLERTLLARMWDTRLER